MQAASADDDPLSDHQDSAWGQYFRDMEGMEQIERDVDRTHQSLPFFSTENPGAETHRQVRWQRARQGRSCHRSFHTATERSGGTAGGVL